MKRALLSILLAACAAQSTPESPNPTSTTSVLVVDRVFDRAQQPTAPSAEVPAASYRTIAPEERWGVAIDGARVVLVPLAKGSEKSLEGTEIAGAAGERRFELKEGAFAGGRFVLRGDEAELTLYGSGVPVVSSERGKVVRR